MKIKTKTVMKCFLWLSFIAAAYAQIVAPGGGVGGGGCSITGGTPNNCNAPASPTMNIAVGDTVIVNVLINGNGTVSISGCNQTWPTPIRSFAGTTQMIWILPHATVADVGCNIHATNLINATTVAVQVYQNVLTVGTPSVIDTNTAGQTTLNSPSITASAPGNVIVGLLAAYNNISGHPYTAVSPAVGRRMPGTTGTALIGDVTATSAGQPIVVSFNSNQAMSGLLRAAVELAPAPTNRSAHPEDAMQTILMRTGRNMHYELPGTVTSPTWCTWFMPVGATLYDYELVPQSTQLNGQANAIKVPSWQMSRVCRDDQGHFWASPPLLAGTGISITPAPTGVTISAGGANAMGYVAGGTAHVPGTVAVAGSTCTAIYNSTSSTSPSAAGVLQSDVVSWSLQPATVSTGWAEMNIYAQASADQVSWRACNMTASSATPSARDINWYVLRRGFTPATLHKPVHKPVHKRRPAK